MPAQDVPALPLKKPAEGGVQTKETPVSRLRRLLGDRADIATSQLELAEIKNLTAEVERERRRLEGDQDGNNREANDEESSKGKINLTLLVETMHEAGFDNRQIGQVLAGQIPTNVNGTHVEPKDNTTETLKLIKEVIHVVNDLGGTNKGASPEVAALKDELKELKSLVKDMQKTNGSSDRKSALAEAADAAGAMVKLRDAFQEVGLMPSGGTPAKTVIQLQEENRHAERMEELKLDSDNKQATANLIGGSISRLGAAAARVIKESDIGSAISGVVEEEPHRAVTEQAATAEGGQIAVMPCKCGTEITVPPEATQITCPNPTCGAVYAREIQ